MNTVGNIVGIQAQEIAKVAEKYAAMSTSEVEVNFHIKCVCYVIEIYNNLVHFYIRM